MDYSRTKKKVLTYYLRHIYFYLTEGCNLACRHCWLSPKFDVNGSKYATLPVELFKTIIHEAKPLGLSRIKLTGGEPLLHPQFLKLLKIVRNENLKLTIETNGVLCTPKIATEIAKVQKRHVSVSIDGVDASTHEWVRGVRGCFKKALQAVHNLTNVNTPPQIIMSIMRCNADQVDEMVRTAERLGASSVKFNIVQPTARGEVLHKTNDTLNISELIKLGKHVEMELAPTTKLKLIFSYPPAFRPLSSIASTNGCSTCGILGILGVIPSGHYALCGIGEHLQDLVFGKAGEDKLEEVWRKNPKLKELREGLPDKLNGVCKRCLMKHICLGSCVAQNYYNTGSFWAPFWFCDQAEKDGLFPLTRLSKVKTLSSNHIN